MWEKLEHKSLGESRERALLQNPNFWQPLQAAGAIISRHDGSAKSARSIVEEIIRRGPTVLEIQRQMVDQHCSLDQTTVGQHLQADLLEARKKHEKELEELEEALKEAIEDKDDKLIQVFTEQKEAQADLLSHSKWEQERLKFSSEQLGPPPSESWADLKAQITEDEKRWEGEIRHLKTQIEGLQSGRSQDMKLALSNREALIVHNKRLEHSAIIQQQNYEHDRIVLEDELRKKELELRRYKQRARSTAISDLFSLFAYDWNSSYRNEDMAYGHSHPSSSSRDNGRNPQRRGTRPAPYQDMSQRTFRSSGGSRRWD